MIEAFYGAGAGGRGARRLWQSGRRYGTARAIADKFSQAPRVDGHPMPIKR
jgi:hypothetical protein